jgi:hypothetical protein
MMRLHGHSQKADRMMSAGKRRAALIWLIMVACWLDADDEPARGWWVAVPHSSGSRKSLSAGSRQGALYDGSAFKQQHKANELQGECRHIYELQLTN